MSLSSETTLKTMGNLKRELRETDCPFFDDGDFEYYYKKNNGDFEATVYEMLLVKSEDSTISVSGLSTQDTSAYFKRLASRHRSFNTGTLSE